MQPGNADKSLLPRGTLNSDVRHPAMEHSPPVSYTSFGPINESESGAARETPEKVGPFRVSHQVSHSERSSVFSGTSLTDGRSVMLKFPNCWGTASDIAAKREFRALRKLQGPGVVNALRALKCGTRSALVTETLQRRSFISRVRRATPVGLLPDLAELTKVFSRLLESLNRIHNSGWVHGSIRAEHVLFDDQSSPVWIDFSNAAQVRRPSWYPGSKKLVASSPYLAPELICGPPEKPAADMFAIGRLLAYSLSGVMPRWFPGEPMSASDLRLQSQLPKNTPRYLIDLCAKLVRMAPVQRPTAAMVYQALTGTSLDELTQNDGSFDRCSSSRCHWSNQIGHIARQAFRNALDGKGSSRLLTIENHQADLIEPIFHSTPYDDARLILTGVCDADEQSSLPGFDSLLDMLAVWFEQLAPTLQESWKRLNYPSLRYASETLGRALGQSPAHIPTPSRSEIGRAINDIVRLFADLSRQRTLVLILHQVDQIDPASAHLLAELNKLTQTMPIIIICTTASKPKLANNPHAAPVFQAIDSVDDDQTH